ncbi:YbhB/YbcL family Raf kinase inhibitor-like protein [Lichenibacterium ramalinae]|uniref:YbhB/YbcL family Raf kinase inhibitor-like protein n=1 Tax=Lichenibacterium ramalinae TaxID=2316527 RepID=A0A4Q2RB07_9HYPH|nr:YbhB/YbcL family Raf kinase inhibitor-like protein [Lichenibacterium ramalinae]RYB02088.1 YbhB/YbcL family Raf kinase inhibitor-like protein [Lichenibacterium ramalinae]
MLEKMPKAIGEALRGVGPGLDKLVTNAHFGEVAATLAVTSPAFADGGPMPADATADGSGTSPPLAWRGVPAGCAEVVVVIEDADSPTPAPLVHAIVYGLPGRDGAVAEGELSGQDGAGPLRLGKSSYLKAAYLPPDPPTGHGPHRYAVQVFALDAPSGLKAEPGRGAVVAVMAGHVVAKGLLIGTYERA